ILTLAGNTSGAENLIVNQGTVNFSKTGNQTVAGTVTVGDDVGGQGADIVNFTASTQTIGALVVNSSGQVNVTGGQLTNNGATTMTIGNTSSAVINIATTYQIGGNVTVQAANLVGSLNASMTAPAATI